MAVTGDSSVLVTSTSEIVIVFIVMVRGSRLAREIDYCIAISGGIFALTAL